ncbi:hypothetical protein QVD17_05135 [Tagetes erecta]|uniref:Uncharacterized protein n=1 Tax=Tagetes erecta TaxID=13708 RepID=A0AAD8LBF9_TARER|nr:hypothetical protein QVD17_05135 [Tagetes erecta]
MVEALQSSASSLSSVYLQVFSVLNMKNKPLKLSFLELCDTRMVYVVFMAAPRLLHPQNFGAFEDNESGCVYYSGLKLPPKETYTI